MKKKLFLIIVGVVLVLSAFWAANRHFKIIDLSSISVETNGSLDRAKVKIERGYFDGNRQSDSVLFAGDARKWTVFDGHSCGLLHTDYGENDFLITYDNRYYLAFRHIITYGRYQHAYNFTFSKQGDTILVHAAILGGDGEIFTRPMRRIADAMYPPSYVEFRDKFKKASNGRIDSTAIIPEELVNSFLTDTEKIDSSYTHTIEPKDWIENRYANFFIIQVDCGAGGECADYDLLVFDKAGKFIRDVELGRLAVDEDFGIYFDYKQLSDTTLRAHSSEHDDDPPTNTDSTWIVSLKL